MESRVSAPGREDLLARIFHGSAQGMAIARVEDGRILEANDAFSFLVGWDRDEILGSTVFDLGLWAATGDGPAARELIEVRGSIECVDVRVATAGGESRIVSFSAELIDGVDPCVIVRTEDVSGRAEAGTRYHELREAEIKYRALVEQIPAITYTQAEDPESPTGFRDLFTSPQMLEILGYTPDEVKADPDLWVRITHPDDRDIMLGEDWDSENGAPFSAEYRMFARDGRVVWFHDVAGLVEDTTTGLRFWQGVLFDITEEKRAQEQLSEAEAKYRVLVEQIPGVVYLGEYGPEGDWLYISPQIEHVMGYSPQEWLAHPHPMKSFTDPDDLKRVREEEGRSYDTGEPFRAEYRMRARDGRTVWFLDEAAVVRNDDGQPVFMQGLMYDITELKQAEQALHEALGREQEAAEHLRELDALKNALLHAISHDLKSPLAAVLGSAATLGRQDLQLSESERCDLLNSISGSARKMDRILTDLLDLDRIDRGILEPELEPVDVGALVRDLVRESGLADKRRVEVSAEPVTIPVDAPKVERIVENLLTNAVRHTLKGTRLWVKVQPADEGVLIAVEDDGCGVPDELKQAIFEAFRRGPDAATHAAGTGIGLSLVARFAELHGGRAWVEDRPGGGAAFRVLLPHAQPAG